MPDPVDQILLRFPGPVNLYASRKKWLLILFISVIFFGTAVYLLYFHQPARVPGPIATMALWGCLVMGGVGAPLALATIFLPQLSKLVLDRNGFQAISLFRTKYVLWKDASGFQIYVPPKGGKLATSVVFDDVTQAGNLARLNTSLSGRNSGMPDTYGFSADDLARLMNAWRERALR